MIDVNRNILIAILGCPAVGKTFLINKLENNLGSDTVYEFNRIELPDIVKENLAKRQNLFENLLWFRNLQVNNYIKALKRRNNITIIDTPFYQYKFYIDFFLDDQFQRNILHKLFELDWNLFEQPDLTIYIRSSPKLIKTYLNYRKGTRAWEEDSNWPDFISKIHYNFENLLNNEIVKPKNLLVIDRKNYDFENSKDLSTLINKIKEKL